MAGRTSKYSATQNSEFEFRTLDVLAHSPEAISIAEIKQSDLVLANLSTQKMARVLSKLNEMGLVRSGKNKASGRMTYKSVAVMREQGYEV